MAIYPCRRVRRERARAAQRPPLDVLGGAERSVVERDDVEPGFAYGQRAPRSQQLPHALLDVHLRPGGGLPALRLGIDPLHLVNSTK